MRSKAKPGTPDSMDVDGQTVVQLKSRAVSGDGSGGEGRRKEGETRLASRAFKEQCSKAERHSLVASGGRRTQTPHLEGLGK